MPSILIKIDTVEVEDGNLVIATVKEGLNKPYHDNKGIVWVKMVPTSVKCSIMQNLQK